jgi:hypothetical protein
MSCLLVTFEHLAVKGKRKLAFDPIALHPTRVAYCEGDFLKQVVLKISNPMTIHEELRQIRSVRR